VIRRSAARATPHPAAIALAAVPPYMRAAMVSNRRLTLFRPSLVIGAVGWICAALPAYAQYYPPPRYGPPPGYSPPPCSAVTRGPFAGAARGAAGGALIGAISGNAGRGAGIGVAVGGIGGAIRRGSARNAGACY
jgi:hypothetical protein